jgi:hypothetical protein
VLTWHAVATLIRDLEVHGLGYTARSLGLPSVDTPALSLDLIEEVALAIYASAGEGDR